jgi:REP element-mobilizing transposase RayT
MDNPPYPQAELPQRQRLLHTPPPWVGPGEIFFVTLCCTPRGKNQLANAAAFSVLVTALEHYVTAGKLWAHVFLATPDHLHALFSFPPQERMDATIRNYKRFTAKAAAVKWQDGFFDHRLRNGENFVQKAHYIRMNPVRAGLASECEKWPYIWPAYEVSTAR